MTEEKETTTAESSNKIGAKDFSLAGQIFAAIWIGAWHIFKFAKIILDGRYEEITTQDIVFSGLSIAACFTPVYFSIIMDKIKNIRFGGEK